MTVKGIYYVPQVEDLDPLASITAPPKNETKVQRLMREQQELFAKRTSDRIDEDLNGEKAKVTNRNPSRKQVRVLVLGHRASGKSTIIKQIQLAYAPRAARCFWTSVVQLNLLQNIADILGIIDQEMATQYSSSSSGTHFSLEFIQKYSSIKLQLSFLNTTRTKLSRQLSGTVGLSEDSDIKQPDRRANEQIGATLTGFVKVVMMLWDDETVQKTLGASLKWQEVALSSRGFFLEDMDRIAVRSYQATDDDIIRARLRRSGIKEYRMVFENDRFEGTEWIMYSFDSTRSTKLAWASFFERLDAVFFVAPLDCFDEWDDNENELKHSMDLWGGVVRNEMFGRAPLVLIHNRIDLLREKLEGGIRVADHVVSFKDRSNDVETVIHYFKHYFKQVYESSISSGKALKTLASKLRSVGSVSCEPQPNPPVDQPERVFKTHVAYDDVRLVKSLVSLIPDAPAPEPPKVMRSG